LTRRGPPAKSPTAKKWRDARNRRKRGAKSSARQERGKRQRRAPNKNYLRSKSLKIFLKGGKLPFRKFQRKWWQITKAEKNPTPVAAGRPYSAAEKEKKCAQKRGGVRSEKGELERRTRDVQEGKESGKGRLIGGVIRRKPLSRAPSFLSRGKEGTWATSGPAKDPFPNQARRGKRPCGKNAKREKPKKGYAN